MSDVPGLDPLLSPDGWPHASQTPVDPDDPGRFHTLFGRDSAITALEVLPARPDVAVATLRALAALQGSREDPETEEEPGKIVHEWWPRAPERLVEDGWPVHGGVLRYYGSADSTSWFLVLLASLDDEALTDELDSAWRSAGHWLERALERGGGLIRHGPRTHPGGLVQQGWRDAEEPAGPRSHGGGILLPNGEVPRPPLADLDTQAVTVLALRALGHLSREPGWRGSAAEMAALIEELFGTDTVALDGDGRQVRGAASSLGWLLWADALPPTASEAAAERLCAPDLLTPWGLRTLSSEHPTYSPDAYHRGAIWPFDSWIGWAGLRAAGRSEEAGRLRRGVLDAIAAIGMAPELYAVDGDRPRPIPIANRVQAWTVGARWALEAEWDGRSPALFA